MFQNANRPRTYIVSPDYDVKDPEPSFWRSWLFGERVILSRGVCNFDLVELQSGQPKRLALKAIYLQAKSFSAFEDIGLFIQMDPQFAQVWTWDAEPLRRRRLSVRNCIPESILYGFEDGLYQLSANGGVEGQVWSRGSLKASRWWASRPSELEWSIFVSQAEQYLGFEVENSPELLDVKATLHQNRVETERNLFPISSVLNLFSFREWLALFLVGVISPFLFQLGRFTSLEVRSQALQSDVSELKAGIGNKRVELGEIRGLLSKFDRYSIPLMFPDVLPALSDTSRILEPINADPIRFSVSDRVLTVVFKVSTEIDRVNLVKELESSPFLTEVTIASERTRGHWSVRGRLSQNISTISSNEK